eukprot:Pgem_evm1s8426
MKITNIILSLAFLACYDNISSCKVNAAPTTLATSSSSTNTQELNGDDDDDEMTYTELFWEMHNNLMCAASHCCFGSRVKPTTVVAQRQLQALREKVINSRKLSVQQKIAILKECSKSNDNSGNDNENENDIERLFETSETVDEYEHDGNDNGSSVETEKQTVEQFRISTPSSNGGYDQYRIDTPIAYSPSTHDEHQYFPVVTDDDY